jgi:hypothetical protein
VQSCSHAVTMNKGKREQYRNQGIRPPLGGRGFSGIADLYQL